MMSVPCNVLCLANKTGHPSTFSSSLFLTTTTQLLLFFTHSPTATTAKQTPEKQQHSHTTLRHNTTQNKMSLLRLTARRSVNAALSNSTPAVARVPLLARSLARYRSLLFVVLFLISCVTYVRNDKRTSVWSLPSLADIRYYLSRYEHTNDDTDASLYFHILITLYLLSSLHHSKKK